MRIYSTRTASSTKSEKTKVNPVTLVGIAITFIGLGVLVQGFRWQILESETYKALAQAQYADSQRQSTSRGIIFASDGTVLAVDQPVWGVYANLSSLEK